MFLKKKTKTKTTIFDIPVKEAKEKLTELSDIIYSVVGSESFAELSVKTPIPMGATKEDVKKILRENAPKKVKQILDTLLIDNFDNIIKASSIIFCENYDFYRTKSINQIAEDYQSLSKENAGKLLSFFSRAGQ